MKKLLFNLSMSAILFLTAVLPVHATVGESPRDSANERWLPAVLVDFVPIITGDYPKYDGSPLPEFPFSWQATMPDGGIMQSTALSITYPTELQEKILALTGHDCDDPIWLVIENERLEDIEFTNTFPMTFNSRICWTCGFFW
ncbi:MAG: hypothetical protein FWG64_02610 [Firmicutes bacterium]|nr:hypothetical protein [Bacillota bacterium]